MNSCMHHTWSELMHWSSINKSLQYHSVALVCSVKMPLTGEEISFDCPFAFCCCAFHINPRCIIPSQLDFLQEAQVLNYIFVHKQQVRSDLGLLESYGLISAREERFDQ